MTASDRSNPAEALRQQRDDWLQPILGELERAERERDWPRVERLCRQALQRDGENWALWQRLAQTHEARADWPQAETLWRHLTQRFSSRPEPYLALAALQRRRGAGDAARVVLQEAERRVGESPDLRQALAVIDDPWAVGTAIPQLGPGATAAELGDALQRAQSFLDAGRFAEAEAVMEQVLQARPRAGKVQLTLAQLRWRRQQGDAVIAQLEPLLGDAAVAAELPERRPLTLLLVEALLARGDWQQAQQRLAELEADPRLPADAALPLLRAEAAIGRGDDAAALALLQRSLQLEPGQGRAERLLAELLMRLGDWDGAIAALLRAIALLPAQPELQALLEQARNQQLWWRGEQALQRAAWGEAAEAYRSLLQRDETHRQALARLDLLASLDSGNLAQQQAEREAAAVDASPQARLAAFRLSLDRSEAQLKMLGVLP